MQKFKFKQFEPIEAFKFDPQGEWPDYIIPWDRKSQPRDMSWGYIETQEGKKHVLAGDWIIKNENGQLDIYKPSMFEKLFEPVD
jgi:hypothetical protein